MHLALPDRPSVAQAWVAAASAVQERRAAHNVLFSVTRPLTFDDTDNKIIQVNDQFLRRYDKFPVVTVANTIFPQQVYERHGRPAFYEEARKVHSKLKLGDWGRYFERLTNCPGSDVPNPLDEIVEKLKRQLAAKQTYRSVYEWAAPIYMPELDAKRLRRQPCLSYLTFKIDEEQHLRLTAVYRNHLYVQKLLGNLVGLSRLLGFVSKEAGIVAGELTCLSTFAEFETDGWRTADGKAMLDEAIGIASECDTSIAESQLPVTGAH